jgi:hypothetical protein
MRKKVLLLVLVAAVSFFASLASAGESVRNHEFSEAIVIDPGKFEPVENTPLVESYNVIIQTRDGEEVKVFYKGDETLRKDQLVSYDEQRHEVTPK